MTFHSPELLILLLLLIPVANYIRKGYRKSRRTLDSFHEQHHHISVRSTSIFVVGLLFVASLVAIAAGPQRYLTSPENRLSGRFVLLIDVSRSMAARPDCEATMRLTRVKSMLSEIVARIPTAQFTLVGFSNLAFPLTELTFNRQYLLQVIENNIYIESVPVPGSDLANALLVIEEKKQDAPAVYENVEQVVVFSDGDFSEEVRRNLAEATAAIREAGVSVTGVGVGSRAGNPIPTLDPNRECVEGQYERADGREFYTYLDEEPLQSLAEDTGGRYFREAEGAALIEFLKTKLRENPDLDIPVQLEDMSLPFMLTALASLIGLIALRYF